MCEFDQKQTAGASRAGKKHVLSILRNIPESNCSGLNITNRICMWNVMKSEYFESNLRTENVAKAKLQIVSAASFLQPCDKVKTNNNLQIDLRHDWTALQRHGKFGSSILTQGV